MDGKGEARDTLTKGIAKPPPLWPKDISNEPFRTPKICRLLKGLRVGGAWPDMQQHCGQWNAAPNMLSEMLASEAHSNPHPAVSEPQGIYGCRFWQHGPVWPPFSAISHAKSALFRT